MERERTVPVTRHYALNKHMKRTLDKKGLSVQKHVNCGEATRSFRMSHTTYILPVGPPESYAFLALSAQRIAFEMLLHDQGTEFYRNQTAGVWVIAMLFITYT